MRRPGSPAHSSRRLERVSLTFDYHAMVQPAVPLRPNSGLPEFGTLIGRSRIYPTSAGERSDRACAIGLRGISFASSSPLTRNGREAPIPTSPLRGEVDLLAR